MDYHGRIINIQMDPDRATYPYAYGHRDARHAAAEIVLEVMAEIDRLRNMLDEQRMRMVTSQRRLAEENRMLRETLVGVPTIPVKAAMRNRENLLALADRLEHAAVRHETTDPGLVFDMFDVWTPVGKHGCNTAACIAGYASDMADTLPNGAVDSEDRLWAAQQWLGLDSDAAYELFSPTGVNWSDITPRIAAEVVRHLAKTGEVDYTITGDLTADA